MQSPSAWVAKNISFPFSSLSLHHTPHIPYSVSLWRRDPEDPAMPVVSDMTPLSEERRDVTQRRREYVEGNGRLLSDAL